MRLCLLKIQLNFIESREYNTLQGELSIQNMYRNLLAWVQLVLLVLNQNQIDFSISNMQLLHCLNIINDPPPFLPYTTLKCIL